MTEVSDSGTRTKSKQTRAQWLDANGVYEESLRATTLALFATRDDIQEYATKMRRRSGQGDWFDSREVLALPQILEVSPADLIAWKKAIGEGSLIDVFDEMHDSRPSGKPKTLALKTDLHKYLAAGVPPEYIHRGTATNFGWTSTDIVWAWEQGISRRDLSTYLSAIARRDYGQRKRRLFRRVRHYSHEEVRERTVPIVSWLQALGIPARYLFTLPDSVSLDDAVKLFHSGAEAEIIVSRLEAAPQTTIEVILAEVEALTAEYWNLLHGNSPRG